MFNDPIRVSCRSIIATNKLSSISQIMDGTRKPKLENPCGLIADGSNTPPDGLVIGAGKLGD